MTIPAHLRPAYDRAIAKGLSHADALDCLSIADSALSPAPQPAQVLASLAPSAAPAAASQAQPQAFAGWTRDATGRVHRPDGAAASLSEALDFARAERGHAPRAAAQTPQVQPQQPQRRQPTDAERRQARLLQIRSGSLRMDAPDAGSSYALRPKSDAVRDALTAHFNEGVSLSDACARFGVSLPPDPAR